MGWLFSIARIAARLGIILIGTIFLRNVSAFLLAFVPVPASVSDMSLTIATFFYFVAFAVLVFGRSLRGMKWPILFGFAVIALGLAAGGLLTVVILVRATPNLVVVLAGDVFFLLIFLLFFDAGWQRVLDLTDRSRYVAAIEVHSAESGAGASSRIRLTRVLSALALAEVPVGFRFQYLPDRHTRLFLFTWAPDESLLAWRQTELHQLLAAHLSGVALSPCKLPAVPLPPSIPAAPIYFRGCPSSAAEGFAALQTALSQSLAGRAAIVLQLLATPARLGRLDEWLARRHIENQAESARQLLMAAALLAKGVPPSPQQAEALAKPATVFRAQQVLQQLRRLDASDLLETQVALIVWHPTSHTRALTIGEKFAARLASALQAATPGASVVYHAPWRPLRRRQLHRSLRAVPAGSTSFLLPREAATYLGIP